MTEFFMGVLAGILIVGGWWMASEKAPDIKTSNIKIEPTIEITTTIDKGITKTDTVYTYTFE